MSLLTSTNTYNNAFAGLPSTAIEIDITATSSSPKFDVGFGFKRADGNKYRYVQYGGTVTAGNLVANNSTTGLMADTDNAVIEPAAAVAVSGETILPGRKGSHYFEFTKASIVKNQFAGGYVVVTGGTAIGHSYRIKGNTATDDPASGNLRFELYEPLLVTLDSTSDISVVGSNYSDVSVTVVGGLNMHPIGIACSGGSDSRYGWICTHGVVGATQDAGVCTAVGQAIRTSTTTDGTICLLTSLETTGNYTAIGYCLDIGDSAGCSTVYLQIE